MDARELNRLEGIFTPLLVPLDGQGQINEPEFRRFVSWLIESGVHGLYPNGSTGEFTRFTPAERRRIVQVVAEETAGRVPILAGAAEANVKETLSACEAYAEMGVRAVAIVAPFYYRLGPESVYAYFAEIARNSPKMCIRDSPLAAQAWQLNPPLPLKNTVAEAVRSSWKGQRTAIFLCAGSGTPSRDSKYFRI